MCDWQQIVSVQSKFSVNVFKVKIKTSKKTITAFVFIVQEMTAVIKSN